MPSLNNPENTPVKVIRTDAGITYIDSKSGREIAIQPGMTLPEDAVLNLGEQASLIVQLGDETLNITGSGFISLAASLESAETLSEEAIHELNEIVLLTPQSPDTDVPVHHGSSQPPVIVHADPMAEAGDLTDLLENLVLREHDIILRPVEGSAETRDHAATYTSSTVKPQAAIPAPDNSCLTLDAEGLSTNSTATTLSGTARLAHPVNLTLLKNNSPVFFETATPNSNGRYSFQLTGLKDGLYAIKVSTRDNAGHIVSRGNELQVSAAPKDVCLSDKSDSGSAGDLLTRFSKVAFTGEAFPRSKVLVEVGGQEQTCKVDREGHWKTGFFTLREDGKYDVATRTLFRDGSQSSASNLVIEKDSQAPDINDLFLSVPQYFTTLTPSITGKTQEHVRVFARLTDASGLEVSTGEVSGRGTFTLEMSPLQQDGPCQLSVTVTDRAGNSSASRQFAVTIDSQPPKPPEVTSLYGAPEVDGIHHLRSQNFTIKGIAESGSAIEFQTGNELKVADITVGPDGRWQTNIHWPETGNFTFHVLAKDKAGLQSQPADVRISIDNQPPALLEVTSLSGKSVLDAGDTLVLKTDFDKPVTVSGYPRLNLVLDSGKTAQAVLNSVGDSGNSLIFHHQVSAGENALKGVGIGSDPFYFPWFASIKSHQGLPFNGSVTDTRPEGLPLIDTVVPEAPEWIGIDDDNEYRESPFITGLNSYLLQGRGEPETDVQVLADGIEIARVHVAKSGIWQLPINETEAQSSSLFTAYCVDQGGHKSALATPQLIEMDTLPPRLEIPKLMPGFDATQPVKDGATVRIELPFSEPVFIHGTPEVLLKVGVDTVSVTLQASSDNNRLNALYKVAEGQFAAREIAVTGFSFPEGSRLTDAAGNPVATSLASEASLPVAINGFGRCNTPCQINIIESKDSGQVGDLLTHHDYIMLTGRAHPDSKVVLSRRSNQPNAKERAYTPDENGVWHSDRMLLSQEGKYPFSASMLFNDGSKSRATHFTIERDSTAPVLEDLEVPGLITGDCLNFSGSSEEGAHIVATLTDASGDTVFTREATATDSCWVWPWCSPKFSMSMSPLVQDGNYNLTISATDKAGNTETATRQVVLDITPPKAPEVKPVDGAKPFTVKEGGPITSKSVVDLDPEISDRILPETLVDASRPSTPMFSLIEESSGVSRTDFLTNKSEYILKGMAEPDTRVQIFESGLLYQTVEVDQDGQWQLPVTVDNDERYHESHFTAISIDKTNHESFETDIQTVTVSKLAPQLQTVETGMTSDPAHPIQPGTEIPVRLNFNEPVFVTGSPMVRIKAGDHISTEPLAIVTDDQYQLEATHRVTEGQVTEAVEVVGFWMPDDRSDIVNAPGNPVLSDLAQPVIAPAYINAPGNEDAPASIHLAANSESGQPEGLYSHHQKVAITGWSAPYQKVVVNVDGQSHHCKANQHGVWTSSKITISPNSTTSGSAHGLKADGSESADRSFTLIHDDIAPVISSCNPSSFSKVPDLQITGHVSESSKVEAVLKNAKGNVVFSQSQEVICDGDSSSFAMSMPSIPADGLYKLNVVATDLAGNPSLPLVRNITFDRTPPEAPEISGVTQANLIEGIYYLPEKTFTLTGQTEAGATVSFSVPKGTTVSDVTVGGNGQWQGAVHRTEPGAFTVQVLASDKAKNVSPPAPVSLVIEDSAPDITHISDQSGRQTFLEAGRQIRLAVSFDKPVLVHGSPGLILQFDNGVVAKARLVQSESDEKTLVFTHTLSKGEEALNGIRIPPKPFELAVDDSITGLSLLPVKGTGLADPSVSQESAFSGIVLDRLVVATATPGFTESDEVETVSDGGDVSHSMTAQPTATELPASQPSATASSYHFNPDKPFIYVGASHGGASGKNIVGADKQFEYHFLTKPGAIVDFYLKDLKQTGAYEHISRAKADPLTGEVHFVLSASDYRSPAEVVYQARMTVNEQLDGSAEARHDFLFGYKVPSYFYCFDAPADDKGVYHSSTFPGTARTIGRLPLTEGVVGNALQFGPDGHLEVDSLPDLFNGSFSVCFHVALPHQAATPQALAGIRSNDMSRSVALGLINSEGNIGIQAGELTLMGKTPVNDGKMHFVCLSREFDPDSHSSTMKVFVDQQLEASGVVSHKESSGLPEFLTSPELHQMTRLGGYSDSGSGSEAPFTGKIDSLKLYHYSLSDQEVEKAGSTVAHVRWSCDDTDSSQCPFSGEQPIGLMIAEVQPSLLKDLDAEDPSLYIRFYGGLEPGLREGNSIHCSYKGEPLAPEDAAEHLYKIPDVTADSLKTLMFHPGESASYSGGHRIHIDNDPGHLTDGRSPALEILSDNKNSITGDQIHIHLGKQQAGNEPDSARSQRDLYIVTDPDTEIDNLNLSEGDRIIRTSEFNALLEDENDLGKHLVFPDRSDPLHVNLSASATHDYADTSPEPLLSMYLVRPPHSMDEAALDSALFS